MEGGKIVDLWKEKVYVACFSHIEHESMSFWNTYSNASEMGIAILFENDEWDEMPIYADETCNAQLLEKCNKSNALIKSQSNVSHNTWGIYDQSLIDIIYVNRDFSDPFQGIYKYVEWDTESETRLRVSIRPKGLEFYGDGTQIKYHRPGEHYLYAKLTPNQLSKMQIILSPYSNNKLYQKVSALLGLNGLAEKIKVKNSVLKDEVDKK